MTTPLKYDWTHPLKFTATSQSRRADRSSTPLSQLESDILHYDLNDFGLLYQAVTHQSADPQHHMRPMDFLGDAVLKLAFTAHLYGNIANKTPKRLNDKRSHLESNKSFAHVVQQHGIHKYMRYSSFGLQRDITDYVDRVADRKFEDVQDVSFPKVLADLLEAIIAAIYMDSELNEETVWQTIKRLMHDRITTEVNT